MANVGFKLGLQASVDALLSKGASAGAVEGSFYLTSDTHRLYIGNKDGSLAPVNEGVITVADISDLPTVSPSNAAAYVGRFYYVSKPNILCVFNGSGWAQINTDTTVKSIENALSQEAANREVLLNQTLTNWNGSAITSVVEEQLSFRGKNGIYVTHATDSKGNPQVVFEGDTYAISAANGGEKNEVKIKLDSDKETNDSEVVLKTGSFSGETDNNVEITRDGNNIIFKAKDTSNRSLEITPENEGFKVAVYDTHNADVSGTINPIIKYGNSGSKQATYKNGVATLNVYSIDEINETLRVLNAMTYRGTIGPTGTVATKITMNNASNANQGCVVYKDSTAINVSIGDTFLVVGNTVTYAGKTLSANTLLIARSTDGTENANGHIESGKLIFDVVASTIDIDTTYRIEGSTITDGSAAKINLLDERTSKDAGSLTLKVVRSAGTETGLKLTRTTKDNGPDGMDDVWTVEHDTTSFTKKTGTKNTMSLDSAAKLPTKKFTIPAVTDVQVNKTGHVTGVTIQDYEVVDTNSLIDSIDNEAHAYTNGDKTKYFGILNTTITQLAQTGQTPTSKGDFAFVSESLQIKTSGNVATTSGGKEMAAGLQIDMVWGTF